MLLRIIGPQFVDHPVVKTSGFDPAHHANEIWLPKSHVLAAQLGCSPYDGEVLESFLQIIQSELNKMQATPNFGGAVIGDVTYKVRLLDDVIRLAATVKLALSMGHAFASAR
jgi:hypothetical protein